MEQQPQQSQEQVYYPPSQGNYAPMMDSKADLLDKIDSSKAVNIIKNVLMGYEWNENEQLWKPNPILQRFALTEFGANFVASLVYPACSQNTSLSNLKEDRINKRLLGITRTLMKMMLDYWQDMGIKSTAQLYHVESIVRTLVWVSLTQSENEGIRRLLNSTISEQRSVNTFGEEKKGGVLGLFRR